MAFAGPFTEFDVQASVPFVLASTWAFNPAVNEALDIGSITINNGVAAPGPIPGTGLLSFAVLVLAAAAGRLRGSLSI